MSLADLVTEGINQASEGIDARPTEEMLRIINEEDQRIAGSVAAVIPAIARAVDAIAARLGAGGRLFYIGAGTSGRLGVLDAAECPPTFSASPEMVQGIIAGGEAALSRATEASEDNPASGAADLDSRHVTSADAVCGIAASGRTPYVLGALARARQLGALTIAVSCVPDPEAAGFADISINPVPGPEVLTGSTRMKAGTATKLVLNMISTGVMIRLGYVYGNLMVNVQPRNDKLRDRARRIVARATGVTDLHAMELLDLCGGTVRAAIVAGKLSVSREEAESLLTRAGGRVSEALLLAGQARREEPA